MDGFLLLVGIALGIACLIYCGPREDSSASDSAPKVGDSRQVNLSGVILVPPVITGAIDFAEDHFARDDDLWFHERYRDMEDLLEDRGSRANEGWQHLGNAVFDGPSYSFGIDSNDDFAVHCICINPATGLPMTSGSEAGFDVGGNPYGFSNDDLSGHYDSQGFGLDSASSSYSSFVGDNWS